MTDMAYLDTFKTETGELVASIDYDRRVVVIRDGVLSASDTEKFGEWLLVWFETLARLSAEQGW